MCVCVWRQINCRSIRSQSTACASRDLSPFYCSYPFNYCPVLSCPLCLVYACLCCLSKTRSPALFLLLFLSLQCLFNLDKATCWTLFLRHFLPLFPYPFASHLLAVPIRLIVPNLQGDVCVCAFPVCSIFISFAFFIRMFNFLSLYCVYIFQNFMWAVSLPARLLFSVKMVIKQTRRNIRRNVCL